MDYQNLLWAISDWILFWQKVVFWIPVRGYWNKFARNYRGPWLVDHEGGPQPVVWAAVCMCYVNLTKSKCLTL